MDKAEARYRLILEKSPKHADALHLLGMVAFQTGNHAEAEKLIKQAIAVDNTTAFFHLNLGNVLKSLKRNKEAIASFMTALSLQPEMAEAHYNLATELCESGNLEGSVSHFKAALRSNPNLAEAHFNLGVALKQLNRKEEAIESCIRAITIMPDYYDAHYNLGLIYHEMKQYDKAVAQYELAVKGMPRNAHAHYYLGNVYLELEQYDKAEIFFRTAITIRQDFADAQNDLSVTLRKQGRTEEALLCAQRSLEIEPGVAACNNLGIAYREDGKIEQAIEYAERAIVMSSDNAEAHWNLALALLHYGDFSRGWRKYEWRTLKSDSDLRSFPYPRWDGSSLKGKTLFIYSEQGIGDQIMFASLFPDIVREPAYCVVDCDRRLVPLFARSFPGLIVIPAEQRISEEGLPAMDMAMPMGSLPIYLRPDLKSFPQLKSYLVADAEKTMEWRSRFSALGEGMKIGISWRGGKDASVRHLRSTMLAQWSSIFSLQGVHFINLQYGDCVQELTTAQERLGVTIHHWEDADPLKDLDSFAAQIAALDLVISVDNSAVHMAGALGIPTLALLPKGCDWRWMGEFEDSPWYSSVKLVRQTEHNQWSDVFNRAREELLVLMQYGTLDRKSSVRSYRDSRDFMIEARPTVGLLNDTTYWYHWGCTGTSRGIDGEITGRGYAVNKIPISGIQQCTHTPQNIHDFDDPEFFHAFSEANSWIMRELRDADIVVVNGEGSLHGVNSYTLNLLYLIYASKVHLRKQVQIINHSCYPDDSLEVRDQSAWKLYKKVYKAIDFVAIREPLSHGLLTREGVSAALSFDCLPLYIRKTYDRADVPADGSIVIAGSVILNDNYLPSFVKYLRIMHGRGHSIKVLTGANMRPARDDKLFVQGLTGACPDAWSLIQADSLDAWLDTIAGASVLVSGRFHHTIAAAMLGTPCILLGSNTPKNVALAQILGIAPPLLWDDSGIEDKLVAGTEDVLNRPDHFTITGDIRNTLCQLAEQNFMGLQ
ncbi:MAG: tetratricopeptide repeat protein, partial [Thermodesulfovibrionales bacterium]